MEQEKKENQEVLKSKRDIEFNKLNEIFAFFEQQKIYDDYIAQIHEKISNEKNIYKERKTMLRWLRVLSWVFSGVLFLVGVLGRQNVEFHVALMGISIFLFISSFVCLILVKRLAKKYGINIAIPRVKEYVKNIEEIISLKQKHDKEKGYCAKAISQDYRNIYAVSYFLCVMNKGRADSIKEAMNLYEDYLRIQELENKINAKLDKLSAGQQNLYKEAQSINKKATAGIILSILKK